MTQRHLHPIRRMKAHWFWPTRVVVWILDHIPHFERWYRWEPQPHRGSTPPGATRKREGEWHWVWHHGRWGLVFLLNTRMLAAFGDEMKYRAQRAEEKKRSSTP